MGMLRQGYLERSNVEVVNELISLITAQRAYEVNSRAIRAGDEMLSTTNNIVS
jgi:flagellar basal-body rod protein FlgG